MMIARSRKSWPSPGLNWLNRDQSSRSISAGLPRAQICRSLKLRPVWQPCSPLSASVPALHQNDGLVQASGLPQIEAVRFSVSFTQASASVAKSGERRKPRGVIRGFIFIACS